MLTTRQVLEKSGISRNTLANWKREGLVKPAQHRQKEGNWRTATWPDNILEKIKEIQLEKKKTLGRPKKGTVFRGVRKTIKNKIRRGKECKLPSGDISYWLCEHAVGESISITIKPLIKPTPETPWQKILENINSGEIEKKLPSWFKLRENTVWVGDRPDDKIIRETNAHFIWRKYGYMLCFPPDTRVITVDIPRSKKVFLLDFSTGGKKHEAVAVTLDEEPKIGEAVAVIDSGKDVSVRFLEEKTREEHEFVFKVIGFIETSSEIFAKKTLKEHIEESENYRDYVS